MNINNSRTTMAIPVATLKPTSARMSPTQQLIHSMANSMPHTDKAWPWIGCRQGERRCGSLQRPAGAGEVLRAIHEPDSVAAAARS